MSRHKNGRINPKKAVQLVHSAAPQDTKTIVTQEKTLSYLREMFQPDPTRYTIRKHASDEDET